MNEVLRKTSKVKGSKGVKSTFDSCHCPCSIIEVSYIEFSFTQNSKGFRCPLEG